MLKFSKILILAILFSLPICAQQKASSIDWDFTYKSLLERNNVAKTEWNWQWLERYKSPAEDWIKKWKGKPIVSSMLIEHPNFHAGEHTTMLLVRTADEAFYWESIEEKEKDKTEDPISPQIYDAIYEQAKSWKQLTPKAAADRHKDELPGYFGFLSIYGSDGSKQMLLTPEDFFICLDKSCQPGKMKSGRLMAAIEPILIPEAKKNYKHKTGAEIARMTPEQRIDEEVSESDHASDSADDQSDLIQKYRRKDGLKGASYLVQLINTYQPKRRDYRYSSAVRIAQDIDERVIRLRGSNEGKRVIEAVEQLAAKVDDAGERSAYSEMDLPHLKGVNLTDHAVRDTLWVKYRIRMSDKELLEFTNYLVKLDPAYPSWSEQEFIKDYSRINEAGNPLQVYIMKDPKRFHEAYLSFKKQANGSK